MVSDNRDDFFKIAEDEKFDKRINWITIMGVEIVIEVGVRCWGMCERETINYSFIVWVPCRVIWFLIFSRHDSGMILNILWDWKINRRIFSEGWFATLDGNLWKHGSWKCEWREKGNVWVIYWLYITFQYTLRMKIRCMMIIVKTKGSYAGSHFRFAGKLKFGGRLMIIFSTLFSTLFSNLKETLLYSSYAFAKTSSLIFLYISLVCLRCKLFV